jgi:hypothetical protein
LGVPVATFLFKTFFLFNVSQGTGSQCACGAGKTFERVCCNLGEGAVQQKWGHGLGFVALSRATEGGRVTVALDGDVSLTRLRAMTNGKVVESVRREDAHLSRLDNITKDLHNGIDY